MATRISQRDLRNDNAEIMRRVENGETFVVTRNSTPVADLVPHRSAERRRFVPLADLASGLEAIGDWGVDAFADERHSLDAVLDDADRDPWTAGKTGGR